MVRHVTLPCPCMTASIIIKMTRVISLWTPWIITSCHGVEGPMTTRYYCAIFPICGGGKKKKKTTKIKGIFWLGYHRYPSNDQVLNLTRVDDVMCFKNISFLFLVQKKRLEVNVGEKWNLLSIIVNIRKSRQYCLNENINDSLFIKWDKQERVLSDITKPRLPLSFWISAWVDFGHVLGNV